MASFNHALSETSDEKMRDHGVSIDSQYVDTGAHLDATLHTPLDPAESRRIRRKIDRHILPLMCILYCIQFMDKTTLGSSAILGILKATHLTTNQYNWLSLAFGDFDFYLTCLDQGSSILGLGGMRPARRFGMALGKFENGGGGGGGGAGRVESDFGWLGTIFYIGYLAFEFPQNLALQRFPVGKCLSLNIFIWGVALCCHAACKNFAGLFVARLILGICEGSITAGFMIVSSMFYTRREHTARVGYWFLMGGIAIILTGFISYGTLHIHTSGFEPWQWLMIITGTITLIAALAFFFLFPDSPTNAWFLTKDERAKAIRRIKENQTGVENKHFKREQMIEALTDPKTWLFALFAAFNNVPNSLTNQLQIIIASFGYDSLQTTLLSCVSGVVEIVSILIGVTIASRIPNSIAWVGIANFIPNLIGVFLINFLPWRDKVGLLFSVWIQITGFTGYVLALTWVSQTTAGHTKRVTTNAVVLSAYCIGNAAGPFMWRAKYKPRNHVPWIIIGVCAVMCMILLYAIRVLLARENKLRDAELPDDSFDDVHVARIDEDGNRVEVKVSKEFLDLTDQQNRDFRYVL